jgi:hypothetical protein
MGAVFLLHWNTKENRLFFPYFFYQLGFDEEFTPVEQIASSIIISAVHQVALASCFASRYCRCVNFKMGSTLVLSLL